MSALLRAFSRSSRVLRRTAPTFGSRRAFSGGVHGRPDEFKVAVVGAAGGIGQPLSLLLKGLVGVRELSLFDVNPMTPGVAVDISHIDTPPVVTGYTGETGLAEALEGADVVVCPAGVPRKPGMTRDDLFDTNASIVAGVASTVGEVCPEAVFCVISNPVNSTVPICAEVLKKQDKFDPKKLIGVTTLDIMRANTFVAEALNLPTPLDWNVPVIGGHAGTTILPLLGYVPDASFDPKTREELTHRIQFGGDEVVKAKAGGGSATLSMASAAARFVDSVLAGLSGQEDVREIGFVYGNHSKELPFFSSPIVLGVEGVEYNHGIPELDSFEQAKFDEMAPDLSAQIQKGIDWAQKNL